MRRVNRSYDFPMSVALKVNDLNAKCMFPHVKAKLVDSSDTKKLGNQRLI